jgi:hypothetical protein
MLFLLSDLLPTLAKKGLGSDQGSTVLSPTRAEPFKIDLPKGGSIVEFMFGPGSELEHRSYRGCRSSTNPTRLM